VLVSSRKRYLYSQRRIMKPYWVLAALVAIGIAGVATWQASISEGESLIPPAIAMGGVVIAAGIGSLLIRRRRERRDLSMEPDSVERQAMIEAQAGAFRDSLVVGVALGAAMLFWNPWPASLAILVLLAVLLVDFNVRFARNKAGMVTAER
jgi:hypothetical protein